MAKENGQETPTEAWPRCECGYVCRGRDERARAEDGRRHAAAAHGVDVSAAAVLATGVTRVEG